MSFAQSPEWNCQQSHGDLSQAEARKQYNARAYQKLNNEVTCGDDAHALFGAPVRFNPRGETVAQHTASILQMFDTHMRGLTIDDFLIVQHQVNLILRDAYAQHVTT
jgi:hypothetical protein